MTEESLTPGKTPVTVGDVRRVMDQAYPPHLAEKWDRVGLICGDPVEPVRRVAVALECTDAVVDDAIASGAQMIVVHHPLLLRGVNSVAADTAKGRIIHRLIRAGVALFSAHTNADSARPGVNDELAQVLGVSAGAPLAPQDTGETDPLLQVGIGRVGQLDTPMPFKEFVERVAARLPKTEWGVRGAGDPERMIRTVAVASGSGDSFLDTVRALGVDAFVTSDLRHHPVDEAIRAGGPRGENTPCIVDTAHWASEFPWCRQAADLLSGELGIAAEVLSERTDPWTVASRGR